MISTANTTLRLRSVLGIFVVALLLAGCVTQKQYFGPDLPDSEIVVIRGYSGPDMWTPALLQGVPNPFITHLDGKSLGIPGLLSAPHRIEVLPGSYDVTVFFEHWFKNYCGTFNINAEADKNYVFREIEGDPPHVQVHEKWSRKVASAPLERVSLFALPCPTPKAPLAED